MYMKKLISFVLTLGFLVPFTMFAQVSGSNSIVVPEVVKNRLMSIWPQIQAVQNGRQHCNSVLCKYKWRIAPSTPALL